ncbi:AraC family transcriptional regulator [Labrys wisconsinensis]|uniref:AraC-like DNA-binding protein n=1 Tax=Labrys wisconsinensis TaxID=425677 RepID=A0ABU0JL82_9HYPH|nr:AraC family transcriptional regulator [Labrys wisconsinensis]MDQ0475038.1 AraC-like DNA-binding protein [Labrys wisconsinensis]
MDQSISDLRDAIARHCRGARCATAVPRLTLLRSDAPTLPMATIHQPVLCIIAQGRKRLMLGESLYEYDAAKYLIVSVDLPVTGGVCEASAEEPYLALSLALDPAALAAMLIDMAEEHGEPELTPGIAVTAVTADLLDPAVRLVRLLDRPRDIAMLAPLIEREMLYRLLTGEQGALLRQIALADSRLSRVSRAIAWIRGNYAQPFHMEVVADIAGMSLSSLHRHFKAVTTMSPLQYQKQVRLQEARRLLLAQRADAAHIGFSVGYDSPSQFSREYARLFGSPPARDAARLRGLSNAAGLPFSQVV